MKTLKCPLCGKELRLKWCPTMHYRVWCNYCEWETSNDRGAPEIAWKDAKEFISKFPPIKRLNQGDNVLIWLSDDIYTVLGTDLEAGKINLQDVYGDADSYYPTNIKKWPWEFEQKGGDNGQ